MLVGTGSVLAGAALDALWSPAAAQPAGQAPALGAQVLGPVLLQPGWNKWIQNGQVAPLHDGEIALLKAIPAAPVFGNAAEARAGQIAAHVRTMQPNAEPAYVAAFLTFAGLQNSAPFREWHERAYEKYKGKTEYPSGDDPYIWGRDRIPIAAAWANVEIGRAVERLQLSGVHIHSFSRDTGARTADGVMEDYLFAHYRVICARLDGNESNPTEGARLAQIMFGRKDLTGMLNVVSRGYANPTDTALMHSRIANKDISLIKYVTDFQGDYKILLYGI